MAKLLVIDPLNLELRDSQDACVWSSRACFDACLQGLPFDLYSADEPDLCSKALDSAGVILGGSEASAWDDSTFNDQLLDVIAICRNSGIPFLGICFGAQLLGRALGAKVGPHPDGIELGAPRIRLTEKGRDHFLFQGLGTSSISSIETHNDAVQTLPPDCQLLASTEHTPVQAFCFQDLLMGVQFHPEMDGEDLRLLWKAFVAKGILGEIPPAYQEVIESCQGERIEPILRSFAERALRSVSVGS